MRGVSIVRLPVLALLVCTAATASAQDVSPPAPPQQAQPNAVTPPVLPQNPLPGTAAPAAQQNPVPDPGTTGQAACLDETGDYETHGRTITFVIGLANKCDKRLKCTIDAYVVGAKGPASGHATLILGVRSSGAAAKATYAMKVKAAGGTAQVSRECRVF